MFFILFHLIFAGLAFVVFFLLRYQHWSNRGVPTLPPSIPFGNVGNPLFRKQSFYESVAEVYRSFKKTSPYAGFYALTIAHFVPIENDLIKRILMTDFASFTDRGLFYDEQSDPLTGNLFFIGGQRWRTMRQKLTATFTSGKMQSMFPIITECSKHLVETLDKYQGDVREVLACYSTEVIGSCAFGVDCGSLSDPEVPFRKFTKKVFEYSPAKTLRRLAQMIWPNFCKMLGMKFIPEEVHNFFVKVVEDTVALRKKTGLKRNDFLDLLIELENDGLLDKREFAAQSFVFFVAGFETSSTTLGYLLLELGKNPDAQEKFRKEIRETMPDGIMTYEKVMGMKYLDQLVDETLRIYPVLPFLNRECTENYKVHDGLVLQKGDKVLISTLGIHMDEEYYPDPEKFDPERFSPQNKQNIKPCTYMPFGEGPRKCIGMRFGQMQVKVGAVAIVSNFKILKNSKTQDKFKYDTNGFTLKSKDGIYLDFKKIESTE